MQGLLAFSGSWHDPVPSLRRAATLFLAIIVIETMAIVMQRLQYTLHPVYLLFALRALDLALLLTWGPWTFSRRYFRIGLKESLLVTSVLCASGVAFLILYKSIFKVFLFQGIRMGSFPDGFPLIAFLTTACFLGPVTEELVFRGILYRLARKRWNIWICTLCISVMFALLHLAFRQSPFVPLLGSVIFCLVYEWNKTLLSPVLVHVTGNLFIYLLPL